MKSTPYPGWALSRLSSQVLLVSLFACGGDGGGTDLPIPATQLALLTPPPSQAQSGVAFTPQPVVQLQDAQGTAVAQANVPVTVSVEDGGGTLVGATTVNTASSGRASFTGLAVGGSLGPRTLTFASPGLTPVSSAVIDLSAGVAAVIAPRDGDQQTAPAGSAVTVPPAVTVTDAYNNPVADVPVTFQVTAGDGSAEPATAVSTNQSGIAAVTSWTLGPTAGPNTLTAVSTGLSGSPVSFTATGSPVSATIRGTITLSDRLLARRATAGSRSGAPAAVYSRGRDAPRFTPDELIVTLRAESIGAPRAGVSPSAWRSAAPGLAGRIRTHMAPRLTARRATITGVSPAILAARIRVDRPEDMAQLAAALRTDPSVATVERNGILEPHSYEARLPTRLPNDPLYARQAWSYGLIDLPEAWSITTGSASVLVAVVDDGIRFDHPAIAANLTSDGYDFVTDASVQLCSGGTTSQSGDGDDYDPDPTIHADYDYDPFLECAFELQSSGGHGLHMAGTIGASGNDGVGISGINWRIQIRPVRVLGAIGGAVFDVAQGIQYAAGLPVDDGQGGIIQATTGAKIINMSFGGPDDYEAVRNAVVAATNAGSLLISSAGNQASPFLQYPAAYPEAVAVSGVGPDGLLASYSNFGPGVDIAAPGGDGQDGDETFGITSTTWDFTSRRPDYTSEAGTSIAASHVSGVAALLLAQNPGLSRSDLVQLLTNHAVDAGRPGRDDEYGAGILNARNSLTRSLDPPRRLRARLYNAVTGAAVSTIAVGNDGSYSFPVTDGSYRVFAGQDESDDQQIGLPGRRWGAFGGTAAPTIINVEGPGTEQASFSVGFPGETEPNGSRQNAHVLPVGGYLVGTMSPTDVDMYRVLVDVAGEYTFETSAVDGACGFAREEDTVMRLLDAQGSLLTSNDDIDAAGLNLCSKITRSLAPGTYHLGVEGERGGTYRVQARSSP